MDIFIYHTTNKSTDTIKKPGDTLRLSGIDGKPFCVQRKVTDIGLTECSGGKCGSSVAYIAECQNTPDMQDPFCENIDAAHNIQFEDDGSDGDVQLKTIISINPSYLLRIKNSRNTYLKVLLVGDSCFRWLCLYVKTLNIFNFVVP